MRIVLIVIGLFCILLAALGASHPRVSFGWLGVFFIGLVLLPLPI